MANEKLKLVIPKGRIMEKVLSVLDEAGYRVEMRGRELRPYISDPEIEVKIMKPQNIPQLIMLGSHDAGFAGLDWCVESNADLVEVLDLKLDPVSIVAAVPEEYLIDELKSRRIVVVSEYERIAKNWLEREGFSYHYMKVNGATEVYPPDDADMIIDNTATGTTLKENKLKIIGVLQKSSTRFVANRATMENRAKRRKIEEMQMLFQSIIYATCKVMLEMNIPQDKADEIIPKLPCMRSPTVAKLYGGDGYAAKIVVEKSLIRTLIPELIRMGATDILEYEINKVVL